VSYYSSTFIFSAKAIQRRKMIMNNEKSRIWKETVMTYLKVPFWQSSGQPEKKHETAVGAAGEQ
jgi:hypothetical protein